MVCILYELLGADDRRFSPHVWRSLMALHHKGLRPERRPLCFTQLDQVEFTTGLQRLLAKGAHQRVGDDFTNQAGQELAL